MVGWVNISTATFHSTFILCNKYRREILYPYTTGKRTPVPVFTLLPNIYLSLTYSRLKSIKLLLVQCLVNMESTDHCPLLY